MAILSAPRKQLYIPGYVDRCAVTTAVVVWEFEGNKVESRLCLGVETVYRCVTKTPNMKFGSAPAKERKESLMRAMPVFVTLIAELFVTPLAAADKSQASKANVEPQLNSYSNNYRNGQVKPGFSARSEIDPAIQQTIGQVFTPFGDSNSGAPQSVEQQAAPPVEEPAAQPAQEAPQAASVTIELGRTTDQVAAGLGQPDKVVKLGAKEIYVYKNVKVTFLNGKVSDVE